MQVKSLSRGAASCSRTANLAYRFCVQASAEPDRVALVIEGKSWSYGDLRNAAARLGALAHWATGRSPSSVADAQPPLMAALGSRRLGQYVASIAAPMFGWVYMPLFAGDPVPRLVHTLRRERPSVLVVDEAGAALLDELLAQLDFGLQIIGPGIDKLPTSIKMPHRFFGEGELRTANGVSLPVACMDDTLAYLMFTSGSTGVPKGVPVSHGNLRGFIENALFRLVPNADDRFGQLSNLNWDLSVLETQVAWAAGASVHRLPDQLIRIPAYVRHHGLTHWISAPSIAAMLDDLHELRPGALACLKCSAFCGEALSTALARQWQQAAPDSIIENFYGPTEAAVAIACHRWRNGGSCGGNGHSVPFGDPFPGQSIIVKDEKGRIVEDGGVGEVYLSGSQVVRGYWNNVQESATRFVDDPDGRRWYKTGDLAVRTPQGWMFAGRVDDQLKVQGYRIERLEVEALLRDAAATQNVAIVALPLHDQSSVMSLHGVVANTDLDASSILRRCRELMPSHMVPTAVHLRDIPRNANGKVDYARLKALLLQGTSRSAEMEVGR